jgi:hypothetical protein
MATKWSPKDPNDIADYWFDWSEFLIESENITAATVTVPAGLTGVAQDFTDKVVRIRLSGGAIGKYAVDCLITTDAGQKFEITKTLEVKERAA